MIRIIILWMVSFAVLAEEGAAATADAIAAKSSLPTLPAAQDPVAMTNLWQLTLGLLVVLGLIVSIAWLLKRTGRFQIAAGGGLRVIGGLSMGSRERVVLVQAGETQLLLGVAPGRVQTLHVLEQPLQLGTPGGGGFAEQLSQVLKKGKSE